MRFLCRSVLGLILCAGLAHAAWAGELDRFAGLSGQLVIAGSEAGLPAVREAASRIMAANPAVTLSISTCSSAVALHRVKLGQAQVCLSDRTFDAANLGAAKLNQIPYAVDPVALAVSPLNPVSDVSLNVAKRLLSGQIRSWSEVGGHADFVLPMYLEGSELENRPETIAAGMSVSTQPAMKFIVARNKDTLGYVSVRDLDSSIKALSLDGVYPDLAAFARGQYRVYRVLSLVGEASPRPLAQAFMDYLRGPDGQELLKQAGYVPLAQAPAQPSLMPFDRPDLVSLGR